MEYSSFSVSFSLQLGIISWILSSHLESTVVIRVTHLDCCIKPLPQYQSVFSMNTYICLNMVFKKKSFQSYKNSFKSKDKLCRLLLKGTVLTTKHLQAPILKATRRHISHTVAVKKNGSGSKRFFLIQAAFLAHSLQKKNHSKKANELHIHCLVFKITEQPYIYRTILKENKKSENWPM